MADQPDELVTAAQRLQRWSTLLVVATAAVLIAERAGYARVYEPGGGTAAAIASQLLFALPALAYLAAIWEVRRAAATVADGAPFATAVASALRRVGRWLIAGSGLAIFAMPAAHGWLGVPYPRLIELDTATVVLAALGLAAGFVARLVERAASVQRELDAIF